MVPGWENLLPPPTNYRHPLRFARHEGLPDSEKSLTMSQWSGEPNNSLNYENNIWIVPQHSGPRVSSFHLLNLVPPIFGANQQLWDPFIKRPELLNTTKWPPYTIVLPNIIIY